MINYTTINKVIPRLPKYVRDNYSSVELKSNILHAYRELGLRQQTESKVTLIELTDHKVQLPDEIKYINMATYANCHNICETMEAEPDEICGCPELEINECVTNYNSIRYELNTLFLNTKTHSNHFIPLKYEQSDYNICPNCPHTNCNTCNDTFSVNSNRELTSSIKEGTLCIFYETEMDKIVDDPNVITYLTYAVQKLVAIDRSYMNESNNMLAFFTQQSNIWYNKARGSVNLSTINLPLINDILFSDSNFLNFKAFRNKHNLYGN